MPEAPVHEDRDARASEYNIRTTTDPAQRSQVLAEAQAAPVQPGAQRTLDRTVGPIASHHRRDSR